MTDLSNIGVVDLMLQIPGQDNRAWYDFMQPLFMDARSRNYAKMPVEYMFRNVPDIHDTDDYIAYTVDKMDAFGIRKAMIGVQHETSREALRRYPDRFFGSLHVDPNRGMDAVRDIVRHHEALGIKAVTGFPSGLCPQVPIDDAKWYPIYAKCIELGLPFCCTVGVPGPRIPMDPQKVERIDPVCWFFPELVFVMRHGAEPWTDLAVKLMLKYDNLYYMTSAFAPKHYPASIVDYANTRGAHKILYAGYWPMGLSLERIFDELPRVPFRDHVWPRFLRDNAMEVFQP
jgi:predicted TIM-barrel fold metal-dependent hydrolase